MAARAGALHDSRGVVPNDIARNGERMLKCRFLVDWKRSGLSAGKPVELDIGTNFCGRSAVLLAEASRPGDPVRFICPGDRTALDPSGDAYACPNCGRSYPVESGVLRMLERDDVFYEGTYENIVRFLPRSEAPWHIWPLWLINSGYPWAVRRFVPAGGTVLELGCAGGVRYFGKRYQAIGCDLSFASIRNAASYVYRVQADAAQCLPLGDESLDAVVSSYFWEHIPPEVKPRILMECRRVLKPGGKLVFLYDLETENPLIKRYKTADKDRYNRFFVEGDGHLGYETPEANRAHFSRAGFRVLQQEGQEKTCLLSASAYAKLAMFGDTARRRFGWTRVLTRFPWFYCHTALLRIVDSTFGTLLSENRARAELTVCEKTEGS